jgi:hypothetical protein
MRRFATRKPLVVAVAMLALALVGLFIWQYPRLFPPIMPTDRALIDSFHAHRKTFEALVKMATEDATIASNSEAETLPVARRSEYSRLLSQIDSKMGMGFGWPGVAFSSAHGGVGLSIGPGWEKGIEFLTAVPSRVGQIVKNLDKDPGRDGVYLVPIEGDWYVYYQRTDYDDLPRKESD